MTVLVRIPFIPGRRTRRLPAAAAPCGNRALTAGNSPGGCQEISGPPPAGPGDSMEHDMTTSASTSTTRPEADCTAVRGTTTEGAAVRESHLRDPRWLPAVVRRLHHRLGGDSGQITPFAIVMIITMVAVGGLVLDAGLALSQKVRALDLAQAAARAGAQKLNLYEYRTSGVAELDPPSATAAARSWLASAGVDGTASATTTTVTVTVRRTSRTQLLQLVGVRQLAVSATASATAVQGVDGPNN